MKRIPLAATVLVAVLTGACSDGVSPADVLFSDAVNLASVDPIFISETGNLTCAEVTEDPDMLEFKVDPPEEGTHTEGPLSVTLSNFGYVNGDHKTFDWSSNFTVLAVFVKAGAGGSNLYDYRPEGSTGDTGLASPGATGNEISHIAFCYKPVLAISKTANTTYTRTHAWDLDKVGLDAEGDPLTELVLNGGTVAVVDYRVKVLYEGSTDSGHAVSGTVTIHNPWTESAVISSITDVITAGDIDVTLDCGEAFEIPYHLAAGATLECSYSESVSGVEDLNTVTVVTTSGPGGGVATAPITWGDPETEVDACVDVYDDKTDPENAQFLGTVCADDPDIVTNGEKVLQYDFEEPIDGSLCGEFQLVNTAWIGDEEGGEIIATWTIDVSRECPEGCTLTQGYWKTHNVLFHGGASKKADETWDLLPDGAETIFFLSGQTYYEVLWTAGGGNAYYNLARQYIAAELNMLAGAAAPEEVQDAFDAATDLFQVYTPAEVGAWRGNHATRAEFIALASILDNYNNGLLGPGHCVNGGSYED
jgi:hypothetical protein